MHRAGCIASALLVCACDSRTSAPPPAAAAAAAPPIESIWFEDVARASGVDFQHVRHSKQRFWFPEIMGSGLAWLDYDGDGKLDLYCVQSGDLKPEGAALPTSKLYRNRGDGTFEDVTARAGVQGTGYGMGCAVGDYDADGDVDLYVTNVGPNVLYQNRGDGTFVDVTRAAGVGDAGWGTSTGFFDFDVDGDLDLFVVNYVRWASDREIDCKSTYGERDYCAPNNYNAPSQSILYRNDGARFTDISQTAGLDTAFGNGLGLALCDFDRDGWLDAYVSNDGMPNQLWINRHDGRFTNRALDLGAAVNRNGAAEASMGTVAADIDNNGFLDLFITKLRGESNTLYFNQSGNFTDRTPQSGTALASLQFTGFGNGLFDFDLDGKLDMYAVNGRVGFWKPFFTEADIYAEPNQLFRGVEDNRFEELQPQGGTRTPLLGTSRGAAFADYDEDGDVDLAYIESNGPVRLLRNVAPRRGEWIQLRVLDARGGDAIGASVKLEALGRAFYREIAPCSSYCSSNDPRAHFGLPRGVQVEQVTVTWNGGTRESFGALALGRVHVLRQGTGRAVESRR